MDESVRVCIGTRKCKRGKDTYHVKWIDPATNKWKSKKSGTDRKKAEYDRREMEAELRKGTYQELKKITWQDFVTDHVAKIEGQRDRVEAERVLNEFGKVCKPGQPRRVTYTMVEAYVAHLRNADEDKDRKANKPATINKKLRYLRAAFNRAVKREYMAKNPMDIGLFQAVEKPVPRVVSAAEETALLDAATELYGLRLHTFIFVALNTGGRRGELIGLTWDRVVLDGDEPHVHFTHTKSHRDRIVPIYPEVVDALRRLQAKTLQEGGPFIGLNDNLGRKWGLIRRKAEVEDVSIHDLRRTYVTRLIRAGVPVPHVQELAGHANAETTLTYYNQTTQHDLRDAVAKLRKAQVG